MKKNHIIIIAITVCLLALIIFFAHYFDNNSADNNISSDSKSDSTSQNDNQTENLIFEAKITDIRSNEIEVVITNGKSTGFSKGEPLILMTENLESSLYSKLTLNDIICVEFNGIVMNSFPGRIGSIFNITLLEDF